MRLQFHLFLRSKKILFLQLAKDATLRLQPHRLEYRLVMLYLKTFFFLGKKYRSFTSGCEIATDRPHQLLPSNSTTQLHPFFPSCQQCFMCYAAVKVHHLKLSLWRSDDDDHPLFGIHSFCRGDLQEGRQPALKNKKKKTSNLHFQCLSVKWQQEDSLR